jgi:hypothetical protein
VTVGPCATAGAPSTGERADRPHLLVRYAEEAWASAATSAAVSALP